MKLLQKRRTRNQSASIPERYLPTLINGVAEFYRDETNRAAMYGGHNKVLCCPFHSEDELHKCTIYALSRDKMQFQAGWWVHQITLDGIRSIKNWEADNNLEEQGLYDLDFSSGDDNEESDVDRMFRLYTPESSELLGLWESIMNVADPEVSLVFWDLVDSVMTNDPDYGLDQAMSYVYHQTIQTHLEDTASNRSILDENMSAVKPSTLNP